MITSWFREAGRFDDVLAVDISASMLALAQRHRSTAVIRYEQRDLLEVTPARDGRFDLVFSAYALHHLPDLRPALRQIRSLVRPGGQAVLVDLCDVPHDRAWFLAEARHSLVRDVLRRRRPVREARELYRLSTDPGWLDHQVADRPLPPGTFEQVYGVVFPAAEFTAMYRTRVNALAGAAVTDDLTIAPWQTTGSRLVYAHPRCACSSTRSSAVTACPRSSTG